MKYTNALCHLLSDLSPSMRREWIEILGDRTAHRLFQSPSMRREWIEIFFRRPEKCVELGLPPCGGSGLKFDMDSPDFSRSVVSLHAEGVD